MKHVIAFASILISSIGIVSAAHAACSLSYPSISNGQPADASQVMANFTDLQNCLVGPTFSGSMTIGSGVAGANNDLFLNGGSGSGHGSQIAIQQSGSSLGWLGSVGRIYGSTSTDLALVSASNIQFGANGASPQMTLSTSGVLFLGGSSTWFGSGGRIYATGGTSTYPVSGYNSGSSGAAFLGRVDSTAVSLASFYYSSSAVGSITTNGASTAYNTSSDERLKSNIRPLSPQLSLKALGAYGPSEFTLRGKPGVGTVAQRLYSDMKAIGIDAAAVGVVTPGDNDMRKREGQPGFRQWQVDSGKMMPYAIGVILEQQRQIEQLQGQVKSLTASVRKITEVRFEPIHPPNGAQGITRGSAPARIKTALN